MSKKYNLDDLDEETNIDLKILSKHKKSSKGPYYAVRVGRINGIYNTWNECKLQIDGFSNAEYKKFDYIEDAKKYIKIGKNNQKDDKLIDNDYNEKTLIKDKNENNHIILLDDPTTIYIYTDGAHIKMNDISITSYAIYFGDGDNRNVANLIEGTINKAELYAIIEAIKIIKDENKNVIIFSDSIYAIKCLTDYSLKLSKKNFISNKSNIELIKEGYNLMTKYPNIKLQHIKAHTNNTDKYSIGNKNADELANNALTKHEDFYNLKFNFGRYKDKTFEYVYNNDKNYFEWLKKENKNYMINLFYEIRTKL